MLIAIVYDVFVLLCNRHDSSASSVVLSDTYIVFESALLVLFTILCQQVCRQESSYWLFLCITQKCQQNGI